MTKHTNTTSTAAKVEDLAHEAASLPPASQGKTLSDEVTGLLIRLSRENGTMKAELHDMKRRVHDTMKMGRDELKSDIAHRPMQSVATAFALGVVASLLVRRWDGGPGTWSTHPHSVAFLFWGVSRRCASGSRLTWQTLKPG